MGTRTEGPKGHAIQAPYGSSVNVRRSGLREEVGAEDFDEFLGGFGEFGSAFFEEEDFSGGGGGGEGADGDSVSFTVADGEFWDDSVAQVGGDHGEGGFELIALEARGATGEAADFKRLIAEAVAIGEVDEFVGVEISGERGIFLQGDPVLSGEREEEGLAEHELGFEGEALLVISGDVAEDREFHGAFGNEADEVGRFLFADVDGDCGVLATEFGEEEGKKVGGESGDDAEVDGAGAQFTPGGELLEEAVFFSKEAFSVLEEEASGVSGDNPAPTPRDELFIELGFQIFDTLADGRLAHAALPGRTTHGPCCDDFFKVTELLEVHERRVDSK